MTVRCPAFLLLFVPIFLAASARPAAAQPPAGGAPPPAAAANPGEEARQHFQRGVILFEDRDYNGALAEFDAAWRMSREPVALYNVGLALKALFRYAEAIDALSRYLNMTAMDKRVTEEQRSEVNRSIAEMRALLAEITLVIQPPAAAPTVTVDGRLTVLDGKPLLLSAGQHVIDVAAAGFSSARRDVFVVAGQPQRVEVTLVEIPKNGLVRIQSSAPSTRVRINGRDVGTAPFQIELPAGGHTVEAFAQGYQASRSELVVVAGQTRNVYLTMEIPPPPREESSAVYKKWWFWTIVGAAAVGGGAAAYAASSGTDARTVEPVTGTLGSSRIP